MIADELRKGNFVLRNFPPRYIGRQPPFSFSVETRDGESIALLVVRDRGYTPYRYREHKFAARYREGLAESMDLPIYFVLCDGYRAWYAEYDGNYDDDGVTHIGQKRFRRAPRFLQAKTKMPLDLECRCGKSTPVSFFLETPTGQIIKMCAECYSIALYGGKDEPGLRRNEKLRVEAQRRAFLGVPEGTELDGIGRRRKVR